MTDEGRKKPIADIVGLTDLKDSSWRSIDRESAETLWQEIKMLEFAGTLTPAQKYRLRRLAILDSQTAERRHQEVVEARRKANRISVLSLIIAALSLAIGIVNWTPLADVIKSYIFGS